MPLYLHTRCTLVCVALSLCVCVCLCPGRHVHVCACFYAWYIVMGVSMHVCVVPCANTRVPACTVMFLSHTHMRASVWACIFVCTVHTQSHWPVHCVCVQLRVCLCACVCVCMPVLAAVRPVCALKARASWGPPLGPHRPMLPSSPCGLCYTLSPLECWSGWRLTGSQVRP